MDLEGVNVANRRVRVIDRISGLPNEIRELILCYLPITDAVRTSALSLKWRFSWTRAVQLNMYFDDDISKEMDEDWYFRVVGNVLLSHVGPIHKFILHVMDRSYAGELSEWLWLLSRKGIKDLTIQYGNGFGNDELGLASSIFKCLELSCLTLEKFSLNNSIAFKGFPNLVKLNLAYVDVFGDILEKVVTNCPPEILIMEGCCFYLDYSLHDRKSAISSCTLKTIKIVCTCYSLSYNPLKYTPNIRVASFTMETVEDEMEYLPSNCFDILESMPKVEGLTFDCWLHKTSSSDIIPKKLPRSLAMLKTLTLFSMDVLSLDQLSFMFCIIRSSPNLQYLTINMANWLKETFSEDSLQTTLAFLKTEGSQKMESKVTTLSVTIEEMGGRMRAMISLIGNLISCFPAVENLFINAPSFGKGSAKLQLSKAVMRTVTKYNRSSSQPTIIYSHNRTPYSSGVDIVKFPL